MPNVLNVWRRHHQDKQIIDALSAKHDIYLRIQSDDSIQLRQVGNTVTYRGIIHVDDLLHLILNDIEKKKIIQQVFDDDDVSFVVVGKDDGSLCFTCSFLASPDE